MNIEELTELANQHILEWSRNQPKLILAIDGYTGAGKTTLLNKLADLNPNIIPVNRDDFLISRKDLEELLNKTEDKPTVFELQICNVEKIKELIAAFRAGEKSFTAQTYNPLSGEVDTEKTFDLSKNILVIEGVFMYHPKLINELWDKRIYLDGDIQKIDQRRIQREKERWGKDYFPEEHPDSYFRQVIIALKRYKEQYHPESIANLFLHSD